jgi:hypothetical protein
MFFLFSDVLSFFLCALSWRVIFHILAIFVVKLPACTQDLNHTLNVNKSAEILGQNSLKDLGVSSNGRCIVLILYTIIEIIAVDLFCWYSVM